MGFRFFRRFKVAPGLTLNLSKGGGSLSFGPRGAKVTVGSSGARGTVDVPGTGLYYTKRLGKRSGSRRGGSRRGRSRSGDDGRAPAIAPEDRLDLGFFERLFIPKDEEEFVDGMRQIVLGNEKRAYAHMRAASHLADGAFMAGMLALKLERFDEALHYFGGARRKHAALGTHFAKHGIDATVSLPITERMVAHAEASVRGILLGMAEAHQALGRHEESLRDLRELREKDAADAVVLLSVVELLVEEVGDKRACKSVVQITKDVSNESDLHAAILLGKGKALRVLGLHTAARDALTAAFRRKKNRDEELLHAIRYERALVYEALGRASRARGELEKLYAEAPRYEDVAERLGLAG